MISDVSDDLTPDQLRVHDVRPFVAARDLALSRRFYEALGWTTLWADGGLALLEIGDQRIYLQDHYIRDWAENTVLTILVDDPFAWHHRVESVLREGDFGDARVTEPQVEAWGATVTYCWDPSGVLLQLMKLHDA